MHRGFTFICAIVIAALSACSTPEERAARAKESSYRAQEGIARERLRLVDQYRDCVIKAGEDIVKVEACDSYLKAAEALQ